MKHFVISVHYTAPIEKIDALLVEHRAFLQIHFDAGTLLMSGPQEPRTGGIILARAASRDAIESLVSKDPFSLAGVATYAITEFNPVKQQGFIADWIAGK